MAYSLLMSLLECSCELLALADNNFGLSHMAIKVEKRNLCSCESLLKSKTLALGQEISILDK